MSLEVYTLTNIPVFAGTTFSPFQVISDGLYHQAKLQFILSAHAVNKQSHLWGYTDTNMRSFLLLFLFY